MSKWKLLVALLLLPFNALAQQTPERDQFTATALQVANKAFTARHNESSMGVSLTHAFEFKFDTAPTYTYTITPCMRGGTCGTATTASVSANATVTVAGTLADYYTVSVTWAGGTVTTLVVNITAVPQSARNGGGGAPSGAAGGDLSGTYPNPTVSTAHITSGTVDGTTIGGTAPSAGTFTTLTSTGQIITSATASLTNPPIGYSGNTGIGLAFTGNVMSFITGAASQIALNASIIAIRGGQQFGFASGSPTATGIDVGLARASSGVLSVDTSAAGNGLGGIIVTNLVGQPTTAPTGTCPTAGVWQLSKDGHLTFCPSAGGTWTTKI